MSSREIAADAGDARHGHAVPNEVPCVAGGERPGDAFADSERVWVGLDGVAGLVESLGGEDQSLFVGEVVRLAGVGAGLRIGGEFGGGLGLGGDLGEA